MDSAAAGPGPGGLYSGRGEYGEAPMEFSLEAVPVASSFGYAGG